MARTKHKQHDALVLYPHHGKPYRVRHLASLVIAVVVVFLATLELGVVIGHNQRPAPALPAAPAQAVTTAPIVVRSGYGYSFTADSNIFTVTGTELDSNGQTRAATKDELGANQQLVSATVKAKSGAVSGRLAATQLTVQFKPDSTGQAAANSFPIPVGKEVAVRTLSSGTDKLNGISVQKTVYEFTAKHTGGKSYAIQWTGVSKDRAFAVTLNGLAGSSTVPGEFATVLKSLNISSSQAVLGAQSDHQTLDSRYLSDALSPAVVEIFHTVCGTLTVSGQAIGDSSCLTLTGSGFIATESGYIATNGHVVVYTAKDALADLVTSSDEILYAYLQSIGLSTSQINDIKSDPAALAALISKIYDLPDSQLHFAEKGELTLVSLGTEKPDLKKLSGLKTSAQLMTFREDSDSIKQADIVAYDYDAKDEFTAIADPNAGFSSSDVALLKVNVQNAPTIPAETGRVVQNERLIVMGFPGDANNVLTDNSQSTVTVTDGVVSSIRAAAGRKGMLYQSDADTSHGNSGGPAIDDRGNVIGLMTYRYADAQNSNAAKSYIRDITDFTNLASANGVHIDSLSSTQETWEHGLKEYSKNHYSAALNDFYKVQAAYPAHRLAGSYIQSAKNAIADGKDVKDLPVATLAAILVGALIVLIATVVIIIRHHGLHRVYQTSVPDAEGQRPVYLAKNHTKTHNKANHN